MKSYSPTKKEIKRDWYLINAEGKVLGRLASEVAQILRGKNKPQFVPFADTGGFVVIVNAEKVLLTGKKMDQKLYYRHSGYIGGLKTITAKKLKEKKPEELVFHAVRGMLPKTNLGRRLNKKLKVYVGPEHPHQAQQPISIS